MQHGAQQRGVLARAGCEFQMGGAGGYENCNSKEGVFIVCGGSAAAPATCPRPPPLAAVRLCGDAETCTSFRASDGSSSAAQLSVGMLQASPGAALPARTGVGRH